MKEFSCGDIVPGCKARFEYASEYEILVTVAVHARETHNLHEVLAQVAPGGRQHHGVAA